MLSNKGLSTIAAVAAEPRACAPKPGRSGRLPHPNS